MNDVLKLLDRLVFRPFGYHAVRSGQVHLRPLAHPERLTAPDSALVAKRLFDRTDGAPAPSALTVMVRTCLRSPRRQRRVDLVEDSQETVVLTCLASLVTSINQAAATARLDDIRVEVDDDHSDADARAKIETVFSALTVPWVLQTPTVTRAGPILAAQFQRAATRDRLTYVVEDDYLHQPEALAALVGFYRQVHAATGGPLVLHPQEQRVLYTRHYPSYLILGPERRWRTTQHMSHTLFTQGRVIRDHWTFFENTRFVGHPRRPMAHRGAERHTTNRLLEILPGFCPIPTLAAHFQAEALLPPFFDWRPLYTAHRPKGHSPA